MKTKNILNLIFGIAVVFLALATVSASTWFYFESNTNLKTMTVNQGDALNLIPTASSHAGVPVSLEKIEAITQSGSAFTLKSWNEPGSQQASTYIFTKTHNLDTYILGSGTFTLKFSATTDAGVESSTLTLIVIPDTTAPVVTITAPTSGTYPSPMTTASFTINTNGKNDLDVSQCEYVLNSGSPVSIPCNEGTNTITGLSTVLGSNTLTVYAEDKVSNVGSDSVTFTITNGTDTNAPGITINAPTNGNTYTSVTQIDFTPVDAEGNLAQCWYSLDNGNSFSAPTSCTDSALNSFTGLTALAGSNTWLVYANDTFGNTGNASVTFNISSNNDTTPPVIALIEPTQGEELDDDSVVFEVSTNEDAVVKYSLDGASNVTMVKTSNYIFESSSVDLDWDESYTVVFYATDLAGNTANVTVYFSTDKEDNDNGDGNGIYEGSYYSTKNITKPSIIKPTININDDFHNLTWWQRFINWLCRLFGLAEAYA